VYATRQALSVTYRQLQVVDSKSGKDPFELFSVFRNCFLETRWTDSGPMFSFVFAKQAE